MLVRKRNGELVEFDREKIMRAVNKAYLEIDGDDNLSASAHIALFVEEIIKAEHDISPDSIYSVEEIQDLVEDELMSLDKDVAKAYIKYRYLHNIARNQYDEFMSAIAEKLEARDVQNQNANVDEHSFGGRVGEASRVLTKQYALDNCMSNMAKQNHLSNRIYIHDLDSYAIGNHNCLTCPMDDLLANGFNTRQTDVRPAQSVNTAFQLVAVIFQLQSLQQFGKNTLPN